MAVEPRNTNRDSPVSHTTCWEDFLNELCQPDPLADLIIDVDGHQLHTSKFLLAKVSSKFRQMFTDPGVEQSGILSLPGTGLHAATEFLRWLLPSEISVLSDETVKPLLQIALDYDIKTLHKLCDQHLVDKLKACERDEDRVECLMMADQFKLTGALEEAVSQLSRLSMDELYKQLSKQSNRQ